MTIRVWRDGVLVQRMCIAKTSKMYFSAEEARARCGLEMLVLPKFWLWHKSGNLNAHICNNHAASALHGKGYLSEQVKLALMRRLESDHEQSPCVGLGTHPIGSQFGDERRRQEMEVADVQPKR